jgi:hypothetical protein
VDSQGEADIVELEVVKYRQLGVHLSGATDGGVPACIYNTRYHACISYALDIKDMFAQIHPEGLQCLDEMR